jgi:quercetin dioxygenase-like cupin family protein
MQTAYVVNKGKGTVLDVCGPTVEFLNSTDEKDAAYCIMIGTIPPGVSVPLHSHPDVESFFTLSGTVQVLFQRGDQLEWIDVKTGDFVQIRAGAKHAFRNTSTQSVVQLIATTPRLGRILREIERPVALGEPPRPPSSDELQHFVRVAAANQHWLGSPEENAAIGLSLPQG